ncbi:hypothetical protein [Limnoraphis robusta]|uniref:hypothetical protein n=1 Tax=Limnoraphis robusta TaxID=1118279 RepID=UPI002B20D7E9|nr:hypothetical protein [Limnoraphis robusta]MEA5498022.1 hypothetical protein [Limnoraphis robusta BA-68 BA1]
MFEKFLLQVVPNAEEIINFKPEVGRGKVFWVCFKNQFGKVSTFLKKKVSDWVQKVYAEFSKYNWLKFDTVESPEGKVYGVSQTYCTCPDFKYHVSKGKTWRSFCKHQLMQLMSKSLTEQITDEKAIRLRKYREEKNQLIEKLDALKSESFFYENFKHYGLYYSLESISLGNASFNLTNGRERLGRILINSYSSISQAFKGKLPPIEFENSLDALNYLLKGITIYTIEEQQAMNSLFVDDKSEPEYPMQDYFEEEKAEESKPAKKKVWLSLNDLQEMPF